MKVASSSIRDLGRVGPPFLHWSSVCAGELQKAIRDSDDSLVIRLIDGDAARDFEGLGRELGRALGRPIAGNQSALDDVMGDVHWQGGEMGPRATVYVIDNAASVLADLPAGLALWGTKAESWARSWAQSVDDGQIWDHEPTALHFIHSTKVLPRNAPNMNLFEIGEQ